MSEAGSSSPDPAPRPAQMFRVPPPLLFLLAFVIGVGAERIAPLAFGFPGREGLGLLICLAGLAIGPGAALRFALRGTTLNPFGEPSSLVANGIYGWTRNPMYLGITVFYLGGVLLLGGLWPLVFLVVPLWILDRVVIPHEEATMGRVFGTEYAAYCTRVRRWL
ncbi:methyltransferase family protein [Solirhodobacter olei]|uniref:methyltransferase family protein n=1 Tax=Solirhodobacter olei TaxID=2493082 RepID=UPI000FDCC3AE|nr:isoprenylcysteine carboxylmethyltransferase family protein [Solirhodobacter olei]